MRFASFLARSPTPAYHYIRSTDVRHHYNRIEAIKHILHTIENSDFTRVDTTSSLVPDLIQQTKAVLSDPEVDHAADFAIGIIRDAIHEMYYGDPLSRQFYHSQYERRNTFDEYDCDEI